MSDVPAAQKILSVTGARLPEGITYNPINNSLIWVDIVRGELHRVLVPKSKKKKYDEPELNTILNSHEVITYQEKQPGFVSSIGGLGLTNDPDTVLVAAKLGVGFVNFKSMKFEYIKKFDFLGEGKSERFRSNDSKVSPAGNFWIGIMTDNFKYEPQPEGFLVKFDHLSGEFTQLLDHQTISNGMVWNKALTKFYHIDSVTREIRVYDYDKTTDTISNGEVFLDTTTVTSAAYEPDGLTIDEKDNLYVALWGGSSVMKIDGTTKQVVAEYGFPAKRSNCPVFGGRAMDELFVSTADLNLDEPDKLGSVEGDLGGAIFRQKIPGVVGRAKYVWKGDLPSQ